MCKRQLARAGRAARPRAGRPAREAALLAISRTGSPRGGGAAPRPRDLRARPPRAAAAAACAPRPRSTRGRARCCRATGRRRRRGRRAPQDAGKLVARLEIVGIGGDPRLERRRIAGRAELGERQRRAGAGDGRVLLDLLGQILELRARLVGAAGGEQGAGEAGNRLGIFGRHLEDLREDAGGALGIALAEHLLAHRDQRLDLGLELLRLALDRQLGEDLVERAGRAGPSVRAVPRSATGWPWKKA